tara:strand:+ start:602 stop:892 length:291 start_codon:yes stop_codon:yes gene_type:complete
MKNVFFHKIVNNTIVVKSQPLSVTKTEINGVQVFTREQGQVTYGLLCLLDDKGNSLDPSSLGLKLNQEMKGFRFSESPVLDQETNEETGMYWVESY